MGKRQFPPAVKAPKFREELIAEQAEFCRKYLVIHGFISDSLSRDISRRLLKQARAK